MKFRQLGYANISIYIQQSVFFFISLSLPPVLVLTK